MKILEQMIKKKVELSEEAFINKNYMRGMWHFYVAYALTQSYLEKRDELLRRKDIIWRRFLLHPEKPDSKKFKELQRFRTIDMSTISEALNKINELKEIDGGAFGDTYKKGTIGIAAFAYPQEGY